MCDSKFIEVHVKYFQNSWGLLKSLHNKMVQFFTYKVNLD